MLPLVVDYINLLLAALLAGAMFCVWLVFNPSQLDASRYIILQQQGIRTLHPVMPQLGGLTIVITVVSAVLARENKLRMSLLIGTAVLFIISGLITRFRNMPINAIVREWNSAAPPEHWTTLRDEWWQWHRLRVWCALAGFGLLAIAMLARKPSSLLDSEIAIFRPLVDALVWAVCLLL